MYEQLREITKEAKSKGLAVVVWSYPRGSDLSKAGETAIDVVAYAAQIAAQMGAHIIKVKLPSSHIELSEAQKAYQKHHVPIETPAERVRHVVQSAFNNKRVVISGRRGQGAMKNSSMKSARFATAAGLGRSLVGTRFSASKKTRIPSWTR